MKHTILVVDDETDNTDALERLFRRKYLVLKAHSGAEALKVLESTPQVTLIISDQRMPEMTGVQLLEKSLSTHPDSIRILLTGYAEIESIIGAINSGQVYRYLTKPWHPADLLSTVNRAIERFELSQKIVAQNKELSVLDHAKDQFMILINHELKTPLTSILSFLYLLKESSLDSDQELYISHIEKNSVKLQKLIDQSLKLVTAEAGRITVDKKNVSIGSLKDSYEKPSFLESIKEKGQSFDRDLDANCPIICDPHIINECLCEILENAQLFSPEKGQITLKAKQIKDKVTISTKNTGVSIEQEVIDKILKPFRLDEDIMNHSKGLGLGLSLTSALLKAHGSQLCIESKNNSVTVSFTLNSY